MSARNTLLSVFAAGAFLFGCSTAGTYGREASLPSGGGGNTCACAAKAPGGDPSERGADAAGPESGRRDAAADASTRYKALH
jgi:hypothetical protein